MPALMLVGGLGFCLLFMVSHRFRNGSEWSEAIFHTRPVTPLKWLTPCTHTVAAKWRKTEEIQAGNVEGFVSKKMFVYGNVSLLHFNIQIDPLLNKNNLKRVLLLTLHFWLSSMYIVPALINRFSQCSSLLCPPPLPLPLFHPQPSINLYPP